VIRLYTKRIIKNRAHCELGGGLERSASTAKVSPNQLNNKRFKKAVRGVMLKMPNQNAQPRRAGTTPNPNPVAPRPRAHGIIVQ
jgi:hypothetical protein